MPSAEKTRDSRPLMNRVGDLFLWQNRGLLLDITIFLVNLLLMWFLTPLFLLLIQHAVVEDPLALSGIFIILIAAFVLPPAGAILKRHTFHRKRRDLSETESSFGCLFNPITYFCLQIINISAINSFIVYYILGMTEPGPEIFLSSLFVLLALAIINTFFVFRYFTPPKNTDKVGFLASHSAASLGDIFIFANMLICQLIWNLLTAGELFKPVSGISEFIGRLLFLCFVAFLIYFPPRIFYLIEDVHKPRTWLAMFLANSPVIFRVLFGGEH